MPALIEKFTFNVNEMVIANNNNRSGTIESFTEKELFNIIFSVHPTIPPTTFANFGHKD